MPDYHDDKTLFKALDALKVAGMTEHQALEGIREMLNAGLFIREYAPEPEKDVRPHSRACGINYHPHGPQCKADCLTCLTDVGFKVTSLPR